MGRSHALLILLIVLTLALRLLIAFSQDSPSYDTYSTLFQAEHIRETGLPSFEEPTTGRVRLFSPLYAYLFAGLSVIIPPLLLAKLLPNLLAVSLIPISFAIAQQLTRTRWIALVTGFFAAFVPMLFQSHLNAAPQLSVVLPVSALLLLSLFTIETKPFAAFVITAFLVLLSPLAWLFVAAYGIYILILFTERMRFEDAYVDIALFSFGLAFWYSLLIFKRALIVHGFSALTGNLPAVIHEASFTEFSFLSMIYAVGLVPIALACLAIYHNTFETRSRKVFLITALVLVVLLSTTIRLIPLRTGLLFLSLAFILLSAPGLLQLSRWIRRTRFSWMHHWIAGGLLLLFILTSLLPALAGGIRPLNGPDEHELAAYAWLRDQPTGVVLARPESGAVIRHLASQPVLAEPSYLLIRDAEQFLADIDHVYTGIVVPDVVATIIEHNISYIMLGPLENAVYDDLGVLVRDECFPILFSQGTVIIYGNTCRTREVRR